MDAIKALTDAAQALANVANGMVGGQYKHDLATGFTLSTNFMHGPAGIFGTAGAERDVFGSRVVPRGLLGQGQLPSMGTVDTNPIVFYLTGITSQSGSEPSTACDTCVKAGNIKNCRMGAAFGKICRETDELDISATGRHVNRGEFFDLRMVNDPLLASGDLWVPSGVPKAAQDVLNSEVMARWLTLGAAFEQTLAPMVFTGNVANNVGTGYAEFPGLETLVSTGHTDVLDQTSCPSLDSDIKDFRADSIENNAAGLFSFMTMLYRYVEHNAITMGFMPVQWKWVMQDALFRKLADYWPCVYASFMCNATNNQLSNNVDGMAQRKMSDELYNGRYLLIDGKQIPVVIDDYVPMKTNAGGFNIPVGTFETDIYLLPFTVIGGRPVLYMEYFDYSAPMGVMTNIQQGGLSNEFWTDAGRFLWTTRRTDWCVLWKAKIEPRLRLLTPHLAGRIQRVRFTPLQMFRQPDPNQPYHSDGGRTYASNAPYSVSYVR